MSPVKKERQVIMVTRAEMEPKDRLELKEQMEKTEQLAGRVKQEMWVAPAPREELVNKVKMVVMELLVREAKQGRGERLVKMESVVKYFIFILIICRL